MIILPAIDIQTASVSAFTRGDFATAHKVAEDPLETAVAFTGTVPGGSHMVDLDGAEPGGGKMRLFS